MFILFVNFVLTIKLKINGGKMKETGIITRIKGRFESNSNPTKEMIETSNKFRELFKELEMKIYENILTTEEKYKAIDKLEEALMWLNKAIFHYENGIK